MLRELIGQIMAGEPDFRGGFGLSMGLHLHKKIETDL